MNISLKDKSESKLKMKENNTLLVNVNILYKDSYFLRMFLLGLIIFNVIIRYGMYFIYIMDEFYDYVGL